MTAGFSLLLTANANAQRAPAPAPAPQASTQRWGFAAPWDAQSDATIREHGHELRVIVTGWIGLDSATARPLLPSPYADTVMPREGTRVNPSRMAIVTSWHGERFHPNTIRKLARDRRRLAETAGTIARYARDLDYAGLVLDFEGLTAADLPAQLAVTRAITDSARALGIGMITSAVPALDTLAYPGRKLIAIVNAVIPMLYDEHWAGSQPGPVSSPAFVAQALAARVREVGPDFVIAGLPTYGYRWIRGRPTEIIGARDAERIAARFGVPVTRDAASYSLRARSGDWELWVTDAFALQGLVAEAERHGVRRVALWRLGLEDPAVWGAESSKR